MGKAFERDALQSSLVMAFLLKMNKNELVISGFANVKGLYGEKGTTLYNFEEGRLY